MLSPPLVSIIMNCHNSDRFLRAAIDSVYNQSYLNWEIIFWDNFSTDNSASIAQSYDNRIKYFLANHKAPLGEARNLALSKANGKYVCFLDCDDLYFPEKLEKQILLMEENGYVFSYGSAVIIDEHDKEIKKIHAKNESGYIFEQLLGHYEINMQSTILLRSFLTENLLNFSTSLQYCPDHNLFMQIAVHNEVGVVKDVIVKYRTLKNSLSSKTLQLAGAEVRYTLNSIIEMHPELKNRFFKKFKQAYGKSLYYDAIAQIYDNNYRSAREVLSPVINLKFEYICLYLILFLPLPRKAVLKLLSRDV